MRAHGRFSRETWQLWLGELAGSVVCKFRVADVTRVGPPVRCRRLVDLSCRCVDVVSTEQCVAVLRHPVDVLRPVQRGVDEKSCEGTGAAREKGAGIYGTDERNG